MGQLSRLRELILMIRPGLKRELNECVDGYRDAFFDQREKNDPEMIEQKYLAMMRRIVLVDYLGQWGVISSRGGKLEPENSVLTDHTIVIDKENILDLLPTSQATEIYQAKETHALTSHVVMPGLINMHTHSPMILLRGLADDLPLVDWLYEHIWPAESKWLSPAYIAVAMKLALAEMIRSGTTSFNEHYYYPDLIAEEAIAAGMRATVGMIVLDEGVAWAKDADEYLKKGIDLYHHYKDHPMISLALAPHSTYSVSDNTFIKLKALQEEFQLPLHIHLHEAKAEIEMSLKGYKKRPIQRLNELGLVSDRLLAVHMVQLTDEDIALFSESGAHAIHCPESNLKVGNGFSPLKRLFKANINVSIGTDGAVSNNDIDMLGELRTATLMAKGSSEDPTLLHAHQALEMATINGAKALGLDHKIGSLKPGKAADLIAIDLDHPSTQPVYNPISQIVYAVSRDQVTDVWVAGKQLLKNSNLTTLNEAEILSNAKIWGEKIRP